MSARLVTSIEGLKEFVGREIGLSDWFEVTQQRIHNFAEAIEDRQWIHTDPERAKRESPYGSTIAHGFLTLSLMGHLMNQAFEVRGMRMGINYGLNRVRFPAPVRSGSRIRGRVSLDSLKDFQGGSEAVYSLTVESEGAAKPCCVAEWIVRYYAE
ncbi:MAG TPA: MaoC family dehydratase [Candidatus Acidoferrales bacterium]|nr:MaoC family dehydratase [Candidatus Acidoferrales bacterium]